MARKHEKRDPITGEYYPAAEPHVDGRPHRGDTVTLRKDQRDLPGAAPLAPTAERDSALLPDVETLKDHFVVIMTETTEQRLDVTRDEVLAALAESAGLAHRQVAQAQAAAIVEFFMDEG